MNASYLIVRALREGIPYRSGSHVVGRAEFRPANRDTNSEREAIARSQRDFREGSDDTLSMRIATLVEAASPEEGHRRATEVFEEVLDVLAFAEFGLSPFMLLEAGCSRSLVTAQVEPRLRESSAIGLAGFAMDDGAFPAHHIGQYLLTRPASDLGSRFLRSLHWSRKAESEANSQMKALFRWFALEAIWTIQPTEDVVTHALCSLGFPEQLHSSMLMLATRADLSAIPNHRPLRKALRRRLEELRSFRHETVHNGFRYLDHAPEQLVLFESLAALAAHAAQRCTELAIIQGLTTGGDLVRYLPILLETHLGAVATASRTMEAVSTILTERPT